MLDRHLLLALAPMLVQGIEQCCPGSGELVRLIEILSPPLKGLLGKHGAAVAFHCRIVGSNQLGRHHAFQLILRGDADERGDGGGQLLVALFRVGMFQPQRLCHLVGQRVVPVVGL